MRTLLLFVALLPLLSQAQNKIDLRTQSKVNGGTGIGLINFEGTTVDTIRSPGANLILSTDGTNTGWQWITPSAATGTVTSVATGIGLTGGPITTTGTVSLDTASSVVLSRQRAANEYATIGSVALKLNISDTAAMLANYSTSGDLTLKLNISDTSSMLSNYLQVGEIGSMAYADSVTFHGNANITTLGTVSSGIWHGTSIDTTYTNAVSKLVGGTAITVSLGGKAYQINADTVTVLASKTRLTNTLGSYVNALSAIGASANANGATITGSTLNLQPASASFGGVVTTGTQTMAGAKTFSSTVTGSASPAFTIGTYGAGIRGTASGNTTWLQLEQSGGNPMAIFLGNTTLDYSILELMDPGGTLNVNNFEFSCLGGGYASTGLLAANSLLAWTRSGLTNGYRMGTQSGPVILFTGGFATTNERVRILTTGEMAVSGTATPLTTPTAHLHIAAGAAGASKAPLKFSSGTNLTSAEAGAMEYDGTNLHFSPSTTRYTLAMYLAGSAALNFGSTAAQSSADLTITVTGAADGDPVILGVPNAATLTNSDYSAWVSAANTVTVRYSNYSAGAQDPASATFKVKVIKN